MTLTPKAFIFRVQEVQINANELSHVDLKLVQLPMHMLHSLHQIIVDEIKERQEYRFNEMMKHSV